MQTPPSPSIDTDSQVVLSVSTAFFPGAEIPCAPLDPADVVLHAQPSAVFFYVHREVLVRHSNNCFGLYILDPDMDDADEFIVDSPAALPSPVSDPSRESPLQEGSMCQETIVSPQKRLQQRPKRNITDGPFLVSLPESADVLNVLLHLLYNIPCERYYPSLDILTAVLPALAQYGISIPSVVTPTCEFTRLFLQHAVTNPLKAYSIAAYVSLEHLATSASRFTLNSNLADLDDDTCSTMGPTYLRRLIFLHLGRTEALKRLLLVQPATHSPTSSCTDQDQKRVLRAWAMATAYLAWEARADLPNVTISASLLPLVDPIECPACKTNLQQQIATMLDDWGKIKSTI